MATGFVGLRSLIQAAQSKRHSDAESEGYGPLKTDPAGLLDLPNRFSYREISGAGQKMDDGFFVPALPDGMAAFADDDFGLTILVRNHEISPGGVLTAFGRNNELLGRVPDGFMYDYGEKKTPGPGGTTTIVYDTQRQRVVRQFLSLVGTHRNCAGGPTPWGSWVSCEETVSRTGFNKSDNELLAGFDGGFFNEQEHGYPFEVPAGVEPALTKPVPLKAMGRFNHEAVAVDPRTAIVYQTEDREDGCIYRFIPDRRMNGRADLAGGGKLQALAISNYPSRDTRNWPTEVVTEKPSPQPPISVGSELQVEWIDLDGIDSPEDDLRQRAFKAGAARFARGEGMWYGDGAIYFACTTGGHKQIGQIWKYTPGNHEGTAEERRDRGRLELFIEPNDGALVQNADNLTVAPWGDLFVCEDRGVKTARMIGVTPEGRPYTFAASRLPSEFAGATFSPDGSTLFFNLQKLGLTIAVTGPWQDSN